MSSLPGATRPLRRPAEATRSATASPAPLSAGQLAALSFGAGRELGWGLRAVGREVAGWRAHALTIPDRSIRDDALEGLAHGRGLIDGAALFWILPARRERRLLRLLVALQALLSYLDVALERGAGPGSAMELVRDAIDLDRPCPAAGHVRHAPGDGGYLLALTCACREGCALLPHYRAAHPTLLREIRRARSFDIEHDRDRERRLTDMDQLAASAFAGVGGASAAELTGGASSLLTVMALLALAADPSTTPADLRRAADAYVWAASAAALLDSHVDRHADALSSAHNWLDYYPSTAIAVDRAAALVDRGLRECAGLRDGERHCVIVASMVAMFLSSDRARDPALLADTRRLTASGGALTRLLVPILRSWRVARHHTDD